MDDDHYEDDEELRNLSKEELIRRYRDARVQVPRAVVEQAAKERRGKIERWTKRYKDWGKRACALQSELAAAKAEQRLAARNLEQWKEFIPQDVTFRCPGCNSLVPSPYYHWVEYEESVSGMGAAAGSDQYRCRQS